MAGEGPKQKSWVCARSLNCGRWVGGAETTLSHGPGQDRGGLQPPD